MTILHCLLPTFSQFVCSNVLLFTCSSLTDFNFATKALRRKGSQSNCLLLHSPFHPFTLSIINLPFTDYLLTASCHCLFFQSPVFKPQSPINSLLLTAYCQLLTSFSSFVQVMFPHCQACANVVFAIFFICPIGT